MRNNQRRTSRAAQEPPPQIHPPAGNNAGLAYVVPTEFVELPSKGQFYPQNHPLFQKETVEIKFMTARDEDILSSTTLIKKGVVIDRLLENLIIEDVDSTTLLIGDRNAIMIAARISSYGAGYKAAVECPSCAISVTYVFDLNKANLLDKCFDKKFLDEKNVYFDENNKFFEFELPTSKVKVAVDPLTGADEKELTELDDEQLITSTLASLIISVNGNMDSGVIEGFIENMPASDSKFVRTLYPNLVPNIDLKQKFVCENCAHKADVEVPLTAEFFWPG